MCRLTIYQVDILRALVLGQKITLGHLADDLLDHLCCEVESLMDKGMDFGQAQQEVIGLAGDLREIQNSTLYIIDKNYRIMKTTMKITGVTSMAFIALGTLLRLLFLEGASILILSGFIIMGLVFFPSAIYVMKKELKHSRQTLMYGVAVSGGIALMAGILFKVLHWPGSVEVLTAAYLILTVLFLPLLLYHLLSNENDNTMKNIFRVAAIAVFITNTGFIFKLNGAPGAGMILFFGIIILSFVFLPWYSYRVYKSFTLKPVSYLLLCTGILYFCIYNLLLAVR